MRRFKGAFCPKAIPTTAASEDTEGGYPARFRRSPATQNPSTRHRLTALTTTNMNAKRKPRTTLSAGQTFLALTLRAHVIRVPPTPSRRAQNCPMRVAGHSRDTFFATIPPTIIPCPLCCVTEAALLTGRTDADTP